ncbi:ATP-binding protein [Rhodobacteraceae bacterium F11138]|uniref:ATP-binding protein n=1 Tax=Sulfitobacter sp. TaxID=1903071 RepID=UPI001A2A477B|nr:ATP-binding protein [Sulfitobacter sp.]MBK0328785.1 ATP-binding protein [Rhodobacteraceae bacterium F11138]
MNEIVSDGATESGFIIPPELAVKAMRDSGYRNTAYALAELIDNSIQADASEVELICVEKYEQVNSQQRLRLQEIGTIDNGKGMSARTLAIALQFGNGTHLDDRAGIGRFGMGLPNSSISQCRRLDVWTWTNGPDNAIHSYLDVADIQSGVKDRVPPPTPSALPTKWRERSEILGTSGTLVVWSRFEEYRLTWRGAEATLRNTEAIIGRMYRKFINDGRVAIHLVRVEEGGNTGRRLAVVNDPLYLMPNSSTPEPFDKVPMFQRWGENDEEFTIDFGGKQHKVFVRFSWAKPETVPDDGLNRGAKPYGKHAMKNLGLSIVREGRELDLDTSWTNSYDPTERWWGAEVEFPATLDEIFGVTNNKQSATIFSQLAQYDWKADAEENESRSSFIERASSEGDPRALLIPIVEHIREQITQLRKRTEQQTKGTRSTGGRKRHEEPGVEDTVTSKFRQRADEGHETPEDTEDFEAEDRDAYEDDLKDDKHYPDDVAKAIADAILTRKRKVAFLEKAMEGYAFFNVESVQGGVTNVVFNSNHPFYENLVKALNPDTEEDTEKELLDRVHTASDTLRIVFSAWARYEMEEVRHKQRLSDMRQEWGKMTRFFLDDGEDD